jgi:N-acetylglucosaminyl-diphospho-decaprenol L-rhamnosyltransferase
MCWARSRSWWSRTTAPTAWRRSKRCSRTARTWSSRTTAAATAPPNRRGRAGPTRPFSRTGRNLGFGAANNRALAATRTPLALLVNPDCEVTPDGLRELVRVANTMPEAAIVAPQLEGAPGRSDVNYRWPSTAWASRGPGAEGPTCVGFVVGAAMLFRLARFEGVGFFDERFFLYYEDDDLCLRLFQQQRPIVVWPGVAAVHRARGSVKGKTPWKSEYLRGYHHAQSKLIYTAKHRSHARARRQRWSVLLGTTLALPLRAIAWSPRLLARMVGRWMGLARWRLHD